MCLSFQLGLPKKLKQIRSPSRGVHNPFDLGPWSILIMACKIQIIPHVCRKDSNNMICM